MEDTSGKTESLWTEKYTARYFELMLAYKDTVMIELGGHDHWADLRALESKDGDAYRNLYIAAGISANHNQMPGFTTMEIDGNQLIPKNLQTTAVDLT